MTETIPCPKHGDRPAVTLPNGFTQCRSCWYLHWLAACLGYHLNHRSART